MIGMILSSSFVRCAVGIGVPKSALYDILRTSDDWRSDAQAFERLRSSTPRQGMHEPTPWLDFLLRVQHAGFSARMIASECDRQLATLLIEAESRVPKARS